MAHKPTSTLILEMVGHAVVVDCASPYVCLGTLRRADGDFLEIADADLHDLRDSKATREVYVYESKQFGIRRNRSSVLLRRDEVVALTRLDDVLES